MNKKTFLGFDITPRQELWGEIKRLHSQVEGADRIAREASENLKQVHNHMCVLEVTLDASSNSLGKAERDIADRDREIAQLRARLSRYHRPKDKNGRFTKK